MGRQRALTGRSANILQQEFEDSISVYTLARGASIEVEIAGCQGNNRKTLELRRYL
jgi:hypothetical protein